MELWSDAHFCPKGGLARSLHLYLCILGSTRDGVTREMGIKRTQKVDSVVEQKKPGSGIRRAWIQIVFPSLAR